MSTLRDRNRRATMEHIQDTAFALFGDRGYHEVTIAQISDAAGVSASTFYRLFRTKEGLFTAPPWEARSSPVDHLDLDRLGDELGELVTGNRWRGMRWVVEEPAVRSAVLATLDAFAEQLTARLTAQGRDPLAAGVQVRGLVFGVYFTSVERWHLDGRPGPFESYYTRALEYARTTAADRGR